MSDIKIEWSEDAYDCDLCGLTTAEGVKVWLHEELIIDQPASAHCYNSQDTSRDEAYALILWNLGFTVEESYVETGVSDD